MEIMAKKMLIDATHAEETRVVVVEGNKVEEFDFESDNRRQLSGNIYLAKVTRIEPSLQAAFIDYGGNRHGFLAFSEIHPDYYQIPVADREALMEEERAFSEAMRRKDDEEAVAQIDESDVSKDENENSALESPEALGSSGSKDDNSNHLDTGEGGEENTEVKSKPSGNKRKTSPKKKAEKNKTSKEDVRPVKNKEEKKPRGRPKKPIKPIAANIETETSDEVINSDDLGSNVSEEKSDFEVAESSGSSRNKRRYNRRVRKYDDFSEKDPRSGKKDDGVEIKEKAQGGVGVDPKKEIESVSEIDDDLDIRRVRKPRQRRYKIQEVIKVRQIMLVQVVKEERGNKGAALTTYR
jgi:ribonuclease E